jgi:hypothetical protein
LKHLLRYLAGRRHEGLTFGDGDGSGLVIWSDSDLAGTYAVDEETRSRMGIAATYNGYLIGWISKHIASTCVSTCEAELHALSEAVKLALHLQYVCQELGLPVAGQIPIKIDALSTIDFAEKPKGAGRMKHLDLRWAWIRDIKESDKIRIEKVPGTSNKADYFTKILTDDVHVQSRNDLLNDDE